MGITGLLPLLEKATRICHVSEFKGQTIAIDVYCWLHKATRSCYMDLAMNKPTNLYVNYILKNIRTLTYFDIKPILVFDGQNLPAKRFTEMKRREAREKAKKQGLEFLRMGNKEEARKYLMQSIDITPEMGLAVIQQCRELGIDCIVAPYESDAQLAYFSLNGIAQVIITEDSDLLIYGCTKVLFKFDNNGFGHLVEAEKIPRALKVKPEDYTLDKFRHMCILSGCDYLESLPGIGIKKAAKFMFMISEKNPKIFLDRLPRYLNLKKLKVTTLYKEQFIVADAIFKHQIIFDPIKKELVPVTPIENDKFAEMFNVKCKYDSEIALQISLGNLNPFTKEQMDNWDPLEHNLKRTSIWSPNFRIVEFKKTTQPPAIPFLPKKELPVNHDEYLPNSYDRMINEEVALPLVPKKEFPDNDDEHLSDAYDRMIKEEVAFYTKPPIVECDVSFTITEPQPQTSPILYSNPFLKKISRFAVAEIKDTSKNVQSRFFFSNSHTAAEMATSFGLNENLNKTSEVHNPVTIIEEDKEDKTLSAPRNVPTLSSVENILNEPPSKKIKLQCQKQLTISGMFKTMEKKTQ